MKSYKITLVNNNTNTNVSFNCTENEYILNSAEKNKIELPYS